MDYDTAMSFGLPRNRDEREILEVRSRAERLVARREAELRDMLAHIEPPALARVDLDTPEAVETFLDRQRAQWRRELGIAS